MTPSEYVDSVIYWLDLIADIARIVALGIILYGFYIIRQARIELAKSTTEFKKVVDAHKARMDALDHVRKLRAWDPNKK